MRRRHERLLRCGHSVGQKHEQLVSAKRSRRDSEKGSDAEGTGYLGAWDPHESRRDPRLHAVKRKGFVQAGTPPAMDSHQTERAPKRRGAAQDFYSLSLISLTPEKGPPFQGRRLAEMKRRTIRAKLLLRLIIILSAGCVFFIQYFPGNFQLIWKKPSTAEGRAGPISGRRRLAPPPPSSALSPGRAPRTGSARRPGPSAALSPSSSSPGRTPSPCDSRAPQETSSAAEPRIERRKLKGQGTHSSSST